MQIFKKFAQSMLTGFMLAVIPSLASAAEPLNLQELAAAMPEKVSSVSFFRNLETPAVEAQFIKILKTGEKLLNVKYNTLDSMFVSSLAAGVLHFSQGITQVSAMAVGFTEAPTAQKETFLRSAIVVCQVSNVAAVEQSLKPYQADAVVGGDGRISRMRLDEHLIGGYRDASGKPATKAGSKFFSEIFYAFDYSKRLVLLSATEKALVQTLESQKASTTLAQSEPFKASIQSADWQLSAEFPKLSVDVFYTPQNVTAKLANASHHFRTSEAEIRVLEDAPAQRAEEPMQQDEFLSSLSTDTALYFWNANRAPSFITTEAASDFAQEMIAFEVAKASDGSWKTLTRAGGATKPALKLSEKVIDAELAHLIGKPEELETAPNITKNEEHLYASWNRKSRQTPDENISVISNQHLFEIRVGNRPLAVSNSAAEKFTAFLEQPHTSAFVIRLTALRDASALNQLQKFLEVSTNPTDIFGAAVSASVLSGEEIDAIWFKRQTHTTGSSAEMRILFSAAHSPAVELSK